MLICLEMITLTGGVEPGSISIISLKTRVEGESTFPLQILLSLFYLTIFLHS